MIIYKNLKILLGRYLLTGGEQIAVEINRWIMPNAVTLEQRKIANMPDEFRAMEDIEKNYTEAI